MNVSVIAFRNVFRNRRRSLLSIIAIAVAAFSITMLFSVLEGIKVDVRRNSWNYETGQVRLRNTDFDRYEHLNPTHYVVPEYERLVERLREKPAVSDISPRINISAAAFRDDTQIAAQGLGVDLELEPRYQDLDSVVAEGRLPEPGTSEAIVGYALARDLGVDIGDQATFLTQTRLRTSNAFTVDIVGLANFPMAGMNSSAFILPFDQAARYLRMGDAASEILVKSGNGDLDELTADVRDAVRESGVEGLTVTPWTEVSGGWAYLQVADAVYNIIALVFFILGSTVVINTTMMTIHERTSEIGTLGAMGMHGGELVRLFFTEAAYLGLAGSFIGVLMGIGLTIPLQHLGIDFGETMEMANMDISSVLYPVLNLRSTLVVFLYSAAVAMAASVVPARRAAKLKPVEALRA
ncbi:MAG: ABC transporter permease [Spirochaetales bacterium]